MNDLFRKHRNIGVLKLSGFYFGTFLSFLLSLISLDCIFFRSNFFFLPLFFGFLFLAIYFFIFYIVPNKDKFHGTFPLLSLNFSVLFFFYLLLFTTIPVLKPYYFRQESSFVTLFISLFGMVSFPLLFSNMVYFWWHSLKVFKNNKKESLKYFMVGLSVIAIGFVMLNTLVVFGLSGG